MALQTITFPILPIVKSHLVVNCVIVFLAVLVVTLRLVSRFVSSAKLWWDDYLILSALLQGIGMLVIEGLYMPMGVGLPIDETLPNLVVILKLMVTYALIYTTCISTVKLSVLCFYLRVFVNDSMRRATKVVLAIVSVWTVANILLLLLICRPFAANYDPYVKGSCGDQTKAFISIGAFNIISDFVVLSLPVPRVWAMNTRKEIKIALTVIFSIGLLVSAVAACRIVSLKHLELKNVTGTMVWVDFLSTLEVNLGILCVSLPMLGPLLSRYRKTSGVRRLGHDNPSSRSGQSGSRFSRKKKRQQWRDDTMTLESIYAHNMDTCCVTMVSATKDEVEAYSQDGSEIGFGLNPVKLASSTGRQSPGIILVQNQWDVQHS